MAQVLERVSENDEVAQIDVCIIGSFKHGRIKLDGWISCLSVTGRDSEHGGGCGDYTRYILVWGVSAQQQR